MRVLMVAYHFPPVGGGGVQRASKFARYLADFDVEVAVLTGPGGMDGRWTPPDPTMLADVEGIEVIRVPGPVPAATSGGMRRRIGTALAARDEFTRWWIGSIERYGPDAARGADLILGELVPYETAFGIESLARRLGLPWVADLQDPWALDEMWLYPSALHRAIDRRRMRKTFATAAAVVMNTPEAAKRVVGAFPELANRPVASITNGFDQADFEGLQPGRDDDAFRIVHTGTLHTELGARHRASGRWRRIAGGMPVPEVDFLTRSHVFLLEAVERLFAHDPTLRGSVEVHLAGVTTPDDEAAAAGHSFVKFHGYVAHEETVSMIRAADLLFLPMHDLPPGLRAGLVPGKAYEYMASGTPILAAVPDGDARDYLEAVGTATVCRPADVSCLEQAIERQLRKQRAGAPRPEPNPSVLARFERRQLTADLAELLHTLV
jgi:glycosyltransferase involved in cell wall biosynthesis